MVAVERQLRHQRREGDLPQVGMDDDARRDIREQRERQPLEDLEDGAVREEQLQAEDQRRHRRHEPQLRDRSPGKQRPGGRDRTQVGARVDRVGDEERKDARADEPRRELAAQRGAEPDAGVQRDSRAQLLHRGHQREGEQRGP